MFTDSHETTAVLSTLRDIVNLRRVSALQSGGATTHFEKINLSPQSNDEA